uniref:EF-hand domain-containing protein n=2 Tax=Acrobeloides nanus TaxID=290746 RepID=A0A914DE67_9BILA
MLRFWNNIISIVILLNAITGIGMKKVGHEDNEDLLDHIVESRGEWKSYKELSKEVESETTEPTKVSIGSDISPYSRLEKYLMTNYNKRIIPRTTPRTPVDVSLSMQLYQIVAVNEPQQYIILNAWVIERWTDEILFWDSKQFDGIKTIVLPSDAVWKPDTTLYNSLIMSDADTSRMVNVKLSLLSEEKAGLVELLYPTLYKFSCILDLRYFPFDIQDCTMTIGSWIYDKEGINYLPHNGTNHIPFGIHNCIENEGWNILGTDVKRREVLYNCCPNKYSLMEFTLYIQRKPLYYIVNLILPTSVITLISIIGFFSTSNMHAPREEKITLGITTLLSMSILIFLVADKLPSTSSFIPLIGWFYTSMMLIISLSTLAASFVIYIQQCGILGKRPSAKLMQWGIRFGTILRLKMPLMMKQAYFNKVTDIMKRIDEVIKKYDTDGSGEIEFPEFRIMAQQLWKIQDEKKIREYFDAIDVSGDGQVSAQEFRDFYMQMKRQKSVTTVQARIDKPPNIVKVNTLENYLQSRSKSLSTDQKAYPVNGTNENKIFAKEQYFLPNDLPNDGHEQSWNNNPLNENDF